MDWHNPRHWQHHVHLEWRHARKFRAWLLGFLGVLLLVGIVPYFLSFDSLKQFLAASVSADTGRTLRIDGRARAVLLPRPAILLEQVSLSEPGQPEQSFALADALTARLELWSLLRGRPKLRELEIKRPELRVVRRDDGSFNFDDLLRVEGSGIRVALTAVHFDDARLRFDDQFLGQSLRSSALDVSLENLSDPKNGQLSASGVVQFGPDEKTRYWQGELNAMAAMRYAEKERRLRIAELQLTIDQLGDSAPQLQLSKGSIKAIGNLDFSWNPLRFVGGQLKLSATGLRAGQRWQSELDIPEIRFADGMLALHRLKLGVTMKSPSGQLATSLEVPTLAGTRQGVLRTDSARIQVELTSPRQQLALNFSSPLEVHRGSLFRLPQYRLQGNYSNRALPRGAIQLALEGSGSLDLRNETLSFDNNGVLDNSPLRASIAIENFVNPSYQVDFDLAKLDLTPYLPVVSEGARDVNPDQPFDLWWLERLNASGQVRIGELVLQKMHINELAFRLAAQDRKLVLDPLSARLYDGQLSGRFELDGSKPEARVRLQQRLSKMNINSLLVDVLDTDRFEGFGSVILDVAAVGDRMSDFRRTAGGSVRLALSKGAIRGLDFAALLRVVNQQIKVLNGEEIKLGDINARTPFTELQADFSLRHGVATNNDLALDAGVLALQGRGVVDFAAGTMDYSILARANPRVPELAGLQGLNVPVHVRGPLEKPLYEVDYASLREQIETRQASQPKVQPRAVAPARR
ncbi:AsmA family protein [Chitinilyticum litopenaei]|uniref:AsmA family protein n=1 Tax=Chitinilyticum litopenaei TaxID=1121276 RepID=UPI000422E63F|nr:AsmA family protein [Chitinilyticum litopenaei]